jgi:hypothetical protein
VVQLGDRTLVVKLPLPGQLAMLSHHTNVIKRSSPGGAMTGEAIEALGHFINIIGHLFGDADRAYIVDVLSTGERDIPEVMALLDAFKDREGGNAKPAKAVRRTR